MAKQTMPNMVSVVSSNLHSVGHAGGELYVTFKDAAGKPTKTYAVPAKDAAKLASELQNAKSPGKLWHAMKQKLPAARIVTDHQEKRR